MDALAPLVIGLLIGIAVGAVAVWLALRARLAAPVADADAERRVASELAEAGERMRELTEERASLQSRLAASDATTTALREQSVQAREQFEAQLTFFREQAQERLAQQETQFKDQIATQESRLADFQERLRALQEAEQARVKEDSKVLVALSPVKESLQAVQAKVVELETQRQQQYGELSQQLKSATESAERLRSTAESLASALRSNSTRGVWGETQLRSVVEAAGLIERVDFDVQTSILSDAGAGRPDMVVHLPGGKNIAVDAKVPFDAYLEASAISSSATGLEGEHRTQLMKRHVKALRDHITALGTKGYWNGLDASPELVIAFIPSESLVSSALEADPSIMEFAFGKKVALASPVTLWSVLKTVAFSWQQDVLTQEARQLFDLSKELYTRLGTTATHIDKLGNTIERSVKDYNAFIGSLERKVYPTARKLASLNSENLFPERAAIEEAPRELTGRELLAALEDPEPLGESESIAVLDESDDERAAEVERTVAEFDALGGGAALRDATFLENEADRVIELDLNLDDKSGTDN